MVLLGAGLLASGCHSVAKDPDPSAPQGMGTQPPQTSDTALPAAMGMNAPMPVLGPQMPGSARDAGIPDDDDDAGSVREPVDAGPWVPAEPTCDNGEWRLAPGFLPAKHVDYIADRDLRIPTGPAAGSGGVGGGGGFAGADQVVRAPVLTVLSSAGIPCANAHDRQACEDALALTPPLGRHLVTTSGDTVRLWASPAAFQLLGEIDTAAEALWVMINARGQLDCDLEVSRDDEGFVVHGLPNYTCPALPDAGYVRTAVARVGSNGDVLDVYTDGGVLAGGCE